MMKIKSCFIQYEFKLIIIIIYNLIISTIDIFIYLLIFVFFKIDSPKTSYKYINFLYMYAWLVLKIKSLKFNSFIIDINLLVFF